MQTETQAMAKATRYISCENAIPDVWITAQAGTPEIDQLTVQGLLCDPRSSGLGYHTSRSAYGAFCIETYDIAPSAAATICRSLISTK
jgi:hypothetical protein